MQAERRKHKRFRVNERALAVTSQALGQIKDISLGGMSYQYVEKEKLSDESAELDIFVSGGSFYLEKMQFDVIADKMALEVSPFSTLSLRHRRIQFGNLSSTQQLQLEYFIDNYTSGSEKRNSN